MYDQTSNYEPDANEHGSRLDPVLARSWLLVNGGQYDRFEPATRSRADVVIRPQVGRIFAGDFTRRHEAILEGEKAALEALPEIRKVLEKIGV